MTVTSTNERRTPLHAFDPAHRKATWWLAAIVGLMALLLAIPATGRAEETNPNNDNCIGSIEAGQPEAGSEEQQVQYKFYCNGAITGYQLQAQIPVTGVAGQPVVTLNSTGASLKDTFSCAGEVPGIALNCVGSTKEGYETVTGQFSIGTKLCKEPRVDPLLTVAYAYLEKGVVTQALAGPFDLGRPKGCPRDSESGSTRLEPKEATVSHGKKKHGKKSKRSEKSTNGKR
jgi:hypothetical protein